MCDFENIVPGSLGSDRVLHAGLMWVGDNCDVLGLSVCFVCILLPENLSLENNHTQKSCYTLFYKFWGLSVRINSTSRSWYPYRTHICRCRMNGNCQQSLQFWIQSKAAVWFLIANFLARKASGRFPIDSNERAPPGLYILSAEYGMCF